MNKEHYNEEAGRKIALAVFFSIIWLFLTGVTYFFNGLISKFMFYIWMILIFIQILKGGYNGIFRKRK